MAEEKRCEGCGSPPPVIESGPFVGSRHLLDYCDVCLKDLCDGCMASGVCHSSDDGSHSSHVEDSDE